MRIECGHFRVNSAAKIFPGIALCNRLLLRENLHATGAGRCPDEEGNETETAILFHTPLVLADALMKKGMKHPEVLLEVTHAVLADALMKKGMKPHIGAIRTFGSVLADALMKKGMKPSATPSPRQRNVLADALMKKGMKQHLGPFGHLEECWPMP